MVICQSFPPPKFPSIRYMVYIVFASHSVCIYCSDGAPMTTQFEQDRTALHSKPYVLLKIHVKFCFILELFYGGYWSGKSLVKARDTYSLATVAITLVFNFSSDRLALQCHVL